MDGIMTHWWGMALHVLSDLIISTGTDGSENNLPFALNEVFKKYDRIIILEDDCIPNKSFFKFCNSLLEIYKHDNRISQISGNNFLNFKNFRRRNNDSYFLSFKRHCTM